MPLERDDLIAGRYQVLEQVRKGSVSELWTAFDTVLRRRVALRIVKEEMIDNDAYLMRFEKDSQIVASLEHPHIVPMHDYGIHQQRPYQIQRMVGVDSLLMWFFNQPKPIPSSTLLRIAQQMASAIDFVHQRGIVHRAISANTVIMDEESQPYLINFTVAKRLQGDPLPIPDPTRFAVLSPEEKAGASTDTGSDIYAFGLLLYSLFTGQREPKYEYNQVISQVRDFRPDLPLNVDLVVNRLLHADPSMRYQRASDAASDLATAFYSGQSKIEGRIFISYASEDGASVRKLASELRRIGLDIWIDQDIPAGTTWAEGIQTALNDCDMMLLVVTEASMDSDYVTHEWSYIMGSGKPVYPFVMSKQLPNNIHPRLEHFQFAFGTDDMLENVTRIINTLGSDA